VGDNDDFSKAKRSNWISGESESLTQSLDLQRCNACHQQGCGVGSTNVINQYLRLCAQNSYLRCYYS